MIAGSHEVINTNGGNPKRNKHAIHFNMAAKGLTARSVISDSHSRCTGTM
jgi:hypothetical protein